MSYGDWVATAAFIAAVATAIGVAAFAPPHPEAVKIAAEKAALGVAHIECARGVSERLALREMAQTGQKPTACVVIMK